MTFTFDDHRPMRSGWNEAMLLRGRKLTDADIRRYERKGWYSEELRQARRDLQPKRTKRSGNFLERDGKLIFAPL